MVAAPTMVPEGAGDPHHRAAEDHSEPARRHVTPPMMPMAPISPPAPPVGKMGPKMATPMPIGVLVVTEENRLIRVPR